jgi:hypothetical protein
MPRMKNTIAVNNNFFVLGSSQEYLQEKMIKHARKNKTVVETGAILPYKMFQNSYDIHSAYFLSEDQVAALDKYAKDERHRYAGIYTLRNSHLN